VDRSNDNLIRVDEIGEAQFSSPRQRFFAAFSFCSLALPIAGAAGGTETRANRDQKAFAETTALGLNIPSQTFNKLTPEVGVWLTQTDQLGSMLLVPQLKLAWTHDFGNQALETQAAPAARAVCDGCGQPRP
jgi:hypothetical protein